MAKQATQIRPKRTFTMADQAEAGLTASLPPILAIEDEAALAELLKWSTLSPVVALALDGQPRLLKALSQAWELIALGPPQPTQSTQNVCHTGPAPSLHMPILIVTAPVAKLDSLLGLERTENQFPFKSFSMIELQARLKAMLCRADPLGLPDAEVQTNNDPVMEVGELRLNRLQRRATLAGKRLALTPREWDLLWFLAGHPICVFSRAELLDKVWGVSHQGYEHTVDSHVNRLRAKLREAGNECNQFIHTVWGSGYRFELQE